MCSIQDIRKGPQEMLQNDSLPSYFISDSAVTKKRNERSRPGTLPLFMGSLFKGIMEKENL